MADKILMIDTGLLIDHFRKTNKANSRLVRLAAQYDRLAISTVTEFEIFSGATSDQQVYWTDLFSEFDVLPFDSNAAHTAVRIRNDLKKRRKSIDTADLFIAATAVANQLTLDTLNRKHFEHVESLELLEKA